MKKVWKWDHMGPEEKRLRCAQCDCISFRIVQLPVARKVHRRRSHKLRVIAICAKHGGERRIKLGPFGK